ncbi:hypothetical protein N0V82_003722 [Gnomoniopsis sp. IMI 355080]|nr:hypothetical protein N0V82_003722 [Gnomoniopsis sp. IMI 355080]
MATNKKQINRWKAFLQQSGKKQDAVNEIKNVPIFTEAARTIANGLASGKDTTFPQFGLLAGIGIAETDSDIVHYNVAAPSSIFICGSQGSGKSHTLSCLLEDCLLPSVVSELPHPLTGIVFHYDSFIADNAGSPCEAAFLSTQSQIKVRVLCAPTNVRTIKKTYSRLPKVLVEELRISETDLNTKRMMDLMAVKTGSTMPLYMQVVKRILRDLRIQQQAAGSSFSYQEFCRQIDGADLSDGQRAPLEQRLDTLESFMVKKGTSAGVDWTSKAGQLTIVDMSCPTIDPESACQLFNICLSLFLEPDPSTVGRVVALDEAHKYMNNSGEASTLTEQLLSTIRLQRHLGARIIVSTQEPTVSPKLLDLCSITLVHRFTSPEWLKALQKHLAGVSSSSRMIAQAASAAAAAATEEEEEDGGNSCSGDEVVQGVSSADSGVDGLTGVLETLTIKAQGNTEQEAAMSMFGQIVQLRVGEALLFAPNALLDIQSGVQPKRLGNGVLKVRIRARVTEDGGRSVMAG